MSYRSHLASVVMALLDDGENDDRNPGHNSPNPFELFSDYPTVVTFNTAEFLLENSQIVDFRLQDAPTNEDPILQNEEVPDPILQNEELSDAIAENEEINISAEENNEQQDDQNEIEPENNYPDPIIETASSTVQEIHNNINNSQETAEINAQIPQPSRQQNIWRRRNRRRNSTDEPSEALTSMSVQGLDCPYVTINDDGVYQCMKCAENSIPKTFKHKYSFQRHAFLYHEGARKVFPCPQCHQEFSRPDKTIKHLKTEHNASFETINKNLLFKPSNFSVEMFKMN